MPFRDRLAGLAIVLAVLAGDAHAQSADVKLVPLWIARPQYPPIARAARVQGVVIVDVEVGADGRVAASTVTRSVPLLDHAALEALKETYFLCDGCGSTPVRRTMQYEFSIDDESGTPIFEVRPERIRVGVITPVQPMMPQYARR